MSRDADRLFRQRFTSVGFKVMLVSIFAGLNAASAGDYDVTYRGPWRTTDGIVAGWDWTLPPGTKPAVRSGIFIGGSVEDFPPGFPGNKLKKVDTTWRELEPLPGEWNFTPLLSDILDESFDGTMLNIRSAVWFTEERRRCGTTKTCLATKNLRTAPDWICGGDPKVIQERTKGPPGARFVQHNVDIGQSCYKDGLIRLFREIKERGIPSMPEVKFVILHGAGDSKGEEWSGKQSRTSAGRAAMREVMDDAWLTAFSKEHAWKLGWPKAAINVPVAHDLFYHCRNKGCGQRNSNIENWMIHFPKPEIGQTMIDANDRQILRREDPVDVYLRTDELNIFIQENRHFQDQNEQYQGSFAPAEKYGSVQFFPLRYRQATLAMLYMRRNVFWAEPRGHMNPQLLSWASLQLGKSATDASDAWIQLMQTYRQAYGKPRRVNNLERWLYQRDIDGVVTEGSARQDHSQPLRPGAEPPFKPGGKKLPNHLNYIDLARVGTKVGIAIDAAFMTGGPHKVAIKVTYIDSGTKSWLLRYANTKGDHKQISVNPGQTDAVRTATMFIEDFSANARGYDFDFSLEAPAGDTPFMFVRLIKLATGTIAP